MKRSRRPYRPVLHTQADVHRMWTHLVQPLGWHDRRLCLVLIGPDGRPRPQVHEFELGVSPASAHDEAEALAAGLSHAAGDLRRVLRYALLYCRPGGHSPDELDRAACRLLYEAARRHDLRVEVIHLGHDRAIVPVPLDEVVAA